MTVTFDASRRTALPHASPSEVPSTKVTAVGERARLNSIDTLRGLVMIVMTLDRCIWAPARGHLCDLARGGRRALSALPVVRRNQAPAHRVVVELPLESSVGRQRPPSRSRSKLASTNAIDTIIRMNTKLSRMAAPHASAAWQACRARMTMQIDIGHFV